MKHGCLQFLFLIFEPEGFYGRRGLSFLNLIWDNNLLRANRCSSVFIESRNTTASCCRTCSRVDCMPWRNSSFDFCTAAGGIEAICLAIFLASGMSRWWGKTWFTAPISNASWASKGLAVKISSAALPYPMSLGRKQVLQNSGVTPIRTKAQLNFAFSEARRISQVSVTVKPKP